MFEGHPIRVRYYERAEKRITDPSLCVPDIPEFSVPDIPKKEEV